MERRVLIYLLENAINTLQGKRLITSPFQVGLSYYNLLDEYGSYLYFATDISPIFKYYHPLWEKQNDIFPTFKTKFIELRKKFNEFKADERIKIINFREPNLINNSFESLRKIKFKHPLVLSNFIINCFDKDGVTVTSFKDQSLYKNKIYTEKQDSSFEWGLGEFLEDKLFAIATYSHYMCAFFTIKENIDIIYSISVFSSEDKVEAINKALIDEIEKRTGVELLESSTNIDEIKKYLFNIDSNDTVQIQEIKEKIILEIEVLKNKTDLKTKKSLLENLKNQIKESRSTDLSTYIRLSEIRDRNPSLPDEDIKEMINLL